VRLPLNADLLNKKGAESRYGVTLWFGNVDGRLTVFRCKQNRTLRNLAQRIGHSKTCADGS
jgi:hypothetical protein